MTEKHKNQKGLDYNKITPNIYIGTNQCCQTHFAKELLKRGVRADISLEEKRLDSPFGVKFYLCLPTKDRTPPSLFQIKAGVNLLENIIQLGEKVYVHCKNGHGRAPTLVASYLITKHGLTPSEAFRFIKKRRKSIHLRLNQKKMLKNIYKTRRK